MKKMIISLVIFVAFIFLLIKFTDLHKVASENAENIILESDDKKILHEPTENTVTDEQINEIIETDQIIINDNEVRESKSNEKQINEKTKEIPVSESKKEKLNIKENKENQQQMKKEIEKEKSDLTLEIEKEVDENKESKTQDTIKEDVNDKKNTNEIINSETKEITNCIHKEIYYATKEEAIQYYERLINEWSDKWLSDQIDDETYYKECPDGYEIISCPYCKKWTINLYY